MEVGWAVEEVEVFGGDDDGEGDAGAGELSGEVEERYHVALRREWEY